MSTGVIIARLLAPLTYDPMAPQIMAKQNLLRLPLDFEATVKALLQTPPPPAGTPGSRKGVKPKGAEAEGGEEAMMTLFTLAMVGLLVALWRGGSKRR